MAMATEATKSKLPLVRIPSDACAVYLGRTIKDGKLNDPGTPHRVHQGEYIEVMPTVAISELIALMRLQEQGVSGATLAEMEDSLNRLCLELSRRIIAWDWTDMMGLPYEQPYGHPEVLARLTTDELGYLLGAAMSTESRDDRKNG